MQTLIPILNDWSAGWSQFMLAVLWQSTLLAAVVAVIAWLARRTAPSVRYWLWQIVAIKLLLAPLWTLGLPLSWLPSPEPVGTARMVASQPEGEVPVETAAMPASHDDELDPPATAATVDQPSAPASRVPQSAARPPARDTISWQAWLMLGWGGVVVWQGLAIVWYRAQLQRFLALTIPATEAIEQIVVQVAAEMQLRRSPAVRVSEVDCSPFVCGMLRPTLVIPRMLDSLLTDGRLRPVIVHELAHLKRRDLWFGWLPQMARIVYFFHPVAYWVAFRVRLEAELACDGWAMNATGQRPADYAQLLVGVVTRLSEPAPLRATSASLDGQTTIAAPVSKSSDTEQG